MSYDSNVHFYNMKQKLKQPHMMVMTDLDDMFLPIPDELLINLSESKDMLLNLLDSFNNMFVNTQDNGSCLSKAINACVRVFKHLGGKLIITQASDNFLATPQQVNFFCFIIYSCNLKEILTVTINLHNLFYYLFWFKIIVYDEF